MGYSPDMPDDVRAKVTEMKKLRVDLEDVLSRRELDKEKAAEIHKKFAELAQEVEAWRFGRRLEKIEERRAQQKLNREVPPGAPVSADKAPEAKEAK